jgi:trehalose 6-phosphate phosphatase
MTEAHDILTALPAPPPPQHGQALFLDVDGTLCAITARPDDVAFDDGLRCLLADAARHLSGAVALVSGRPLAWLADEAAGLPLALAGTHGLEIRLADGRETMAPLRPGLEAARDAVRDFAAAHPDVVVENKARGLAIHYRLALRSADAVLEFAADLARRHDLPVQHGKLVVELKGGDGDKGVAIAMLLQQPQFAGRVPVFAGDDETDEAAFKAVAAAGGFGILVGPPRFTAASHGLADPQAVHAWLGALS